MADMTRFDLDKVNVIGKLGTTPQERGLTTQQFKDKFDEGPIALGKFVNETLIPEVEAHMADSVTDTDGAHGFKIESGSWTPILIGANGGQAVNSGSTNGSYIKIGPLVYIQFYLETSSKGNIAPGAIRLGGLPFAVAGLVGQDNPVPIIAQFNGVTFPTGVNWVFGQATRYQTYIDLRFGKSGAAGIPILDTDIATAIGLRGSMIYKVE